jgi:hypothetical protein
MAHLGGRSKACQDGTRAREGVLGRFVLCFSCHKQRTQWPEGVNKVG